MSQKLTLWIAASAVALLLLAGTATTVGILVYNQIQSSSDRDKRREATEELHRKANQRIKENEEFIRQLEEANKRDAEELRKIKEANTRHK